VCVPAVLGALVVWIQNPKKNKKWKASCVVALQTKNQKKLEQWIF